VVACDPTIVVSEGRRSYQVPTMPYVQLDESGQVIAMSAEPKPGFDEIAADSPELNMFFERSGVALSVFHASDAGVIRVLDDLINLLVDGNIIRFTDLPQEAQAKLLERRSLREASGHWEFLEDSSGLI
jgi:hypothetical protein